MTDQTDPPDPPDGPAPPDDQPIHSGDSAPQQPEPSAQRNGSTPTVPAGIGIGCLGHILAVVLGFIFISLPMSGYGGIGLGMISVFGSGIILPLVGIGMLFSPKYRPMGIGILIASCAVSVIVLGPCLVSIYGNG